MAQGLGRGETEMSFVDLFCYVLLIALGTWKLFELLNIYGDRFSKWIIKKVQRK